MESNKIAKVSLAEYPKYSPLLYKPNLAEDTLIEGDPPQEFVEDIQ